jgi:hypothetical protein
MLCASVSLFIYTGVRFIDGRSSAEVTGEIRSCERRRYILTTDMSKIRENRIQTRMM